MFLILQACSTMFNIVQPYLIFDLQRKTVFTHGSGRKKPPCHRTRLLQVSPEEARRVICAPKEVVEEFQEEVRSKKLLDDWWKMLER